MELEIQNLEDEQRQINYLRKIQLCHEINRMKGLFDFKKINTFKLLTLFEIKDHAYYYEDSSIIIELAEQDYLLFLENEFKENKIKFRKGCNLIKEIID